MISKEVLFASLTEMRFKFRLHTAVDVLTLFVCSPDST